MAKAPTIALSDLQDTMIQKKAKATASTSETKLSRTERERTGTADLQLRMVVETIARIGIPAELVVRSVRKKAINDLGAMVTRNGNRAKNKMSLVLVET